jgi:hypothetical protein
MSLRKIQRHLDNEPVSCRIWGFIVKYFGRQICTTLSCWLAPNITGDASGGVEILMYVGCQSQLKKALNGAIVAKGRANYPRGQDQIYGFEKDLAVMMGSYRNVYGPGDQYVGTFCTRKSPKWG